MLGNKEIRKDIRSSMFSFLDFQLAAAEIKEGSGYGRLSKLLAAAGVSWEPSKDSPLPSIVAALERDGQFSATIEAVNEVINQTCFDATDYRKQEFVDRILALGEAVEHIRRRSDDAATVMRERNGG